MWATILVSALIGVCAAGAVTAMIWRKKKGKTCCGGCSSCPCRCQKKTEARAEKNNPFV